MESDFIIENLFFNKLEGNPSNTHMIGLQKLNESKTKHNLADLWQKVNPHKRLFTYHNSDKTIHRIDRIYLTITITAKICKIHPTFISDHGSVAVIVQVKKRTKRFRMLKTKYLYFKT